MVKETQSRQLRRSATITGAEKGAPVTCSSSAIPRALGKRKRDAEIKLAPEDHRVFSGLHFYFFPNDEIHPARRARIIKALEYGATWQREWSPSITHLVVDNSMKWDSVLSYLSTRGGLPSKEIPPNVVVVNEDYPSDCITYRVMVHPKQIQYLVNGYTPPVTKPTETAETSAQAVPVTGSSQVSDESLQPKPPGSKVRAKQPQTPSRTEETPSLPSAAAAPSNENSNEGSNGQTGGDELDAAIRDAKGIDESDMQDQSEEPTATTTAPWQQNFQCMHKHTGGANDTNNTGPNTRTLQILTELSDYYTTMQDPWRSKSYRSAIATLRKHPTRITTKAQALSLPGIGDSIAEKIEEIVQTNRLRKVAYTTLDPTQKILQTFLKIHGVGYPTASRWVAAGHRTLHDVMKNAASLDLTPNQRIGIEHYDDFNARIPRSEVERHANIVRSALQGLTSPSETYAVYTMGSYRRGAESSGDIDLLITASASTPLSSIRATVVERLVPLLTRTGYLVATLAQTALSDGTKWQGACRLPNAHIWRRLDLLLVPEAELGAALIYFTGNDIFNRSLRLLAGRKGMRLNQRGLYRDVMSGEGREKVTEGELVEGRDERVIFKALGVPWRPPNHRIC
ncbi:hypothetical protein AAFC00_005540 [Neodothiora populina]